MLGKPLRAKRAVAVTTVALLFVAANRDARAMGNQTFQIRSKVEDVFVRTLFLRRLGMTGGIPNDSPRCDRSTAAEKMEVLLLRPCRFYASRIIRERFKDTIEIILDDGIHVSEDDLEAFRVLLARFANGRARIELSAEFMNYQENFRRLGLGGISWSVPPLRVKPSLVAVSHQGNILQVRLGYFRAAGY